MDARSIAEYGTIELNMKLKEDIERYLLHWHLSHLENQVQHDQVDQVSQLYPGNVKPPDLLRNLKASRQLPREQQHVDSVLRNVRRTCRLVSCRGLMTFPYALSGNALLLGYRVL